MTAADRSLVQLTYTIAGGSQHSGRYVAENILVDKPEEQNLLLYSVECLAYFYPKGCIDLEPLESITFGKFFRSHPCNMKEFKLYVGLSEDNMTEVLYAGLKNDPASETFSIRSVNRAGLTFPTRYIKIQPLSAHGQSFHTSIWYVSLSGIADEHYVSRVRIEHEEYQEQAILGYVLKHLRQRRLLTPFQSALERSGLRLEHPLVTSLHAALVLQGDFTACEATLNSIASAGLFSSSLLTEQPQAQWHRLHATDADGDTPSARGGHAMCIDEVNGRIYLFGGWDGQKNLDDFWVYDIHLEQWKVINYATQREPNGPGPRSCHKMLFDTATGCIYLFGRLDDVGSVDIADIPMPSTHTRGVEAPATSPVSPRQVPSLALGGSRPSTWSMRGAELYRYHTRGREEGKWEIASFDTVTAGGPPQVFDHQMVIDSEAQIIYVSGGRVVDGDWESMKFAGLYSFDIRRNSWKLHQSPEPSTTQLGIPPRFGHAMVLDPRTQTLFIFGGQREERYMSDMYAYHIPSDTITELSDNFTSAGGPDSCFTHRAVIDPELREIYVFCGLTRSAGNTETVLEADAPYWIYRYERPDRPGRWTKVLQPDDSVCPAPRYAHQVVYDPTSRWMYMHGGNAGLESPAEERRPGSGSRRSTAGPVGEMEVRIEHVAPPSKNMRLDDFWALKLMRPSTDEFIRRGKYLIRQQQFRELCEDSSPIKALSYLQTEVAAVVDHGDGEETATFRSLLSHLLSPSSSTAEAPLTRKRSREDSPVEPVPSAEDDPMAETHSPVHPSAHDGGSASGSRSVASMQEDPVEGKTDRAKPVSPARYKQRTGVFERLMKLVDTNAKQPEKDLVQLINVDAEDVY